MFNGGVEYEVDGVSYEDELEYILLETVGFCGCGSPEDAAKFLMECLETHEKPEDHDYDKDKEFWSKHGSGGEYFIRYALDRSGLTEHGGSVGGAWLTDFGNHVLELLRKEFKKG